MTNEYAEYLADLADEEERIRTEDEQADAERIARDVRGEVTSGRRATSAPIYVQRNATERVPIFRAR